MECPCKWDKGYWLELKPTQHRQASRTCDHFSSVLGLCTPLKCSPLSAMWVPSLKAASQACEGWNITLFRGKMQDQNGSEPGHKLIILYPKVMWSALCGVQVVVHLALIILNEHGLNPHKDICRAPAHTKAVCSQFRPLLLMRHEFSIELVLTLCCFCAQHARYHIAERNSHLADACASIKTPT